jgi:chitosanase
MRFKTIALVIQPISALSVLPVPSNVREYYNRVKSDSSMCSGNNKLATGFYASDGGRPEFSYCLDPSAKTIFLHGPLAELADMDVDCDGDQHFRGDGRCHSSRDTQSVTAFKDTVRHFGISDINSYIHPYVVFGNEGSYSPTFDPQKFGVEPLSLIAVVCGDKMVL